MAMCAGRPQLRKFDLLQNNSRRRGEMASNSYHLVKLSFMLNFDIISRSCTRKSSLFAPSDAPPSVSSISGLS